MAEKNCPSCGAQVHEHAAVCRKCNTNLITGARLKLPKAPAASRNWIVVTLAVVGIALIAAVLLRWWLLSERPIGILGSWRVDMKELQSRPWFSQPRLLSEATRKHYASISIRFVNERQLHISDPGFVEAWEGWIEYKVVEETSDGVTIEIVKGVDGQVNDAVFFGWQSDKALIVFGFQTRLVTGDRVHLLLEGGDKMVFLPASFDGESHPWERLFAPLLGVKQRLVLTRETPGSPE